MLQAGTTVDQAPANPSKARGHWVRIPTLGCKFLTILRMIGQSIPGNMNHLMFITDKRIGTNESTNH